MCAYVLHAMRLRKRNELNRSRSRVSSWFCYLLLFWFICLLLCADFLLPFFGRFGEAQAQQGGASFLGLEGFGCFTGGGAIPGEGDG